MKQADFLKRWQHNWKQYYHCEESIRLNQNHPDELEFFEKKKRWISNVQRKLEAQYQRELEQDEPEVFRKKMIILSQLKEQKNGRTKNR